MYIFIVTNSPGELTGWVRPVARSLKQKNPGLKIIVVITPCQYASGKEREIAERFPEVDYVMGKGEYLKYILLGIRPAYLHLNLPCDGAVLYLGGDPIHSLLVSRKLGLPAFSYTHRLRYKRHFRKFMVPNDELRRKFIGKGLDSEKVVVVGDIVGDAVRPSMAKDKIFRLLDIDSDSSCISLFPGSRPHIVRYMAPFFLRVCELIREEFPQTHFLLILSPFVARPNLVALTREKLNRVFEASTSTLKKEEGRWKLITESGLKVPVIEENRYEVMSISTMAITIPGTNTHELSFLGVPMIVVTPLNKPEAIPLEGLAGLIGNIPLSGRFIKRWIVGRYNRKVEFTAIPNIRAGEEIVPEVRGIIEARDVAREAIGLLQEPDRRTMISRKLKEIMGVSGAANRMAEVVLSKTCPTA